MLSKSRAGDDLKAIRCQAGNGQVTFDTAMLVGHLGIGNCADGLIHLVIGDALQECQPTRSQHLDLAKRGFIEHCHALAGGLVFRADSR